MSPPLTRSPRLAVALMLPVALAWSAGPAHAQATPAPGETASASPAPAAPAKAAPTPPPKPRDPRVRRKTKGKAPIGAQRIVTPSPTQSENMLRGTNAYRAKDYPAAIEAYSAVIAEGPLNIALLNKGRSLQRLGECEAAAEAFGQVVDAPAVRSPSPDTVRGALNRYTEQLSQECPGQLLVQCAPANGALTLVDSTAGMGEGPDAPAELPPIACGRPIKLPAGRYRVIISAYDRTRSYQATVVGVQMTALNAEIAPPPELVVKEVEAPLDPLELAARTSWALAGAALMTGALATYLLYDNNQRIETVTNEPVVGRRELDTLQGDGDTYESIQAWSYGTMFVAGVAGLVLYQMADDPEPDDKGPELLPIAAPDRAGALLRLRF